MNILITGATGFIGAQYIKRFSHHHFTALCRNTEAGARMLPSYVTCISDLSTLQNLDSFDAGWSMSTLMHVPESEVEVVVTRMVRPLRAGAPLMVGLWGGERRDEIDTTRLPGERRLFSLRPFERNAELLSAAGSIETSEIRGTSPEGWEYHTFLIRV